MWRVVKFVCTLHGQQRPHSDRTYTQYLLYLFLAGSWLDIHSGQEMEKGQKGLKGSNITSKS